MNFEKEYLEAQDRKQKTLQKISNHIGGDLEPLDETDAINFSGTINSGCNMYDFATEFLIEIQKQKSFLKVPLREEFFGIFYAMLLAYGDNNEEINEKIEKLTSGNPYVYPDKKFIEYLVDFMKQHWKCRVRRITEQRSSNIKNAAQGKEKMANLTPQDPERYSEIRYVKKVSGFTNEELYWMELANKMVN